ncbi:sentrin-specific protease 1-like protein [Cinnamomum micranthum f. kanehirae]|uniref:Sentrin-specific protease 1-like protein n=1 Tax=Cinnamomum micranthum f. kanehirae TaxID=337451 RepID=A0A3S3MGX3_9MAGN|nr:sentrin-specific protease 1-like protein [Cinnamomum micranthum f. kanehirae]
MYVSSIVSPRRSPRFSISTPVQITYDSPPPKIQKEVISAGPPSEKIFSEKKKAILKKKKERTQITPDSKEHTAPESSQKSGPMHVSSIVSPRSPRFSISTPVQRFYDGPAPKIQKEVISASPPSEKVPSIVIPVKNATRKKKVPAKFAGFSPTLKWPPNSDYKLTDEETKLLNQFWDDYCKRADKLSIYCTSPTSKKLKKLLSREWMETGLLQNWFDVYLKPKAPHAYFIDANASDIWLKQSKERYVHIFGEFGWRVDIMKKHEVIVIPMCYLEHFTVIMGYPKEGKWEYYNSMPMDKRQWPKAEEFIIWLNDSFADFGWEGPRGWIRRNVDDVPIQENLYDCGFFVMGFVEHAILNRKIAFNQQDMMYYRCKLVVHLYNRQWELYQRMLQFSK